MECGSNGRTIPFFPIWLAPSIAPSFSVLVLDNSIAPPVLSPASSVLVSSGKTALLFPYGLRTMRATMVSKLNNNTNPTKAPAPIQYQYACGKNPRAFIT
uniref:Uncharacterized protein n=1 Tax=Rhizophora mucronata TaxID=61149 RepID=A0A2P2QM83_RHIMU